MSMLRQDIMTNFGYNQFIVDTFFDIFTPSEAVDIAKTYQLSRPLTIRVNTIKSKPVELVSALAKRGIKLDVMGNWSRICLTVISSSVPIGVTPEYLAGYFTIQSVASYLPCMVLAPYKQETVLDMSAALGAKTTYIAALMENNGIVIANDTIKGKIISIVTNVHRMSVKNVIVCHYHGSDLHKAIGSASIDRILLDVPCSGTGLLSKDPFIKTSKNSDLVCSYRRKQKQMILSAIDMVNENSETGGYIVYSTCSLFVEENEYIVDFALKNRKIRIVKCGVEFGRRGFVKYKNYQFHHSLDRSRRFYPHLHNVDAFFVCKIKKMNTGLKA